MQDVEMKVEKKNKYKNKNKKKKKDEKIKRKFDVHKKIWKEKIDRYTRIGTHLLFSFMFFFLFVLHKLCKECHQVQGFCVNI